MSVVLMNLVLGLAISDIEELQRNSAVRYLQSFIFKLFNHFIQISLSRRMVLETFTVMFIESFFIGFDRMTGIGR